MDLAHIRVIIIEILKRIFLFIPIILFFVSCCEFKKARIMGYQDSLNHSYFSSLADFTKEKEKEFSALLGSSKNDLELLYGKPVKIYYQVYGPDSKKYDEGWLYKMKYSDGCSKIPTFVRLFFNNDEFVNYGL